jgi:hypothetical protein
VRSADARHATTSALDTWRASSDGLGELHVFCPECTEREFSLARARNRATRSAVVAYAVVDEALSPDFLVGDALGMFVRREDAERFVEVVRGDDPELAKHLRIEERELEAGGLN